MPKSFISEHSAEYVLVPKLIGILEKQFTKVIPIYFWTTREGSIISRACKPFYKVRIIRVFARRPKVNFPNQETIEVKFNESLFERVDVATSMGIPTFAGVPLISSILDLSLNNNCAWFKLNKHNSDVIYELSLTAKIMTRSFISSAVEGPIAENLLIDKIIESTVPMTWENALNTLKFLKSLTRDSLWFGGGNYRPFYVLFFDAAK